jgi:protein ImuA
MSDRTTDLGALRQRLALIERGRRGDRSHAVDPALPFGAAEIDRALPGGGIALGALHEVLGLGAAEEEAAEGAGFLAGILARLEPGRPVLWCARRPDLHAPGLALHGLAPERLILARPQSETDVLWAMEEGLKCRALAAVVGEVEALPLAASRRLQLAAETGGIAAFALRRRQRSVPNGMSWGSEAQPTAAVTRWRIASCPSRLVDEPGIGRPLWLVELLRCRGGVPARWIVEACDETGHVHLAPALADRPAAPAAFRAAG